MRVLVVEDLSSLGALIAEGEDPVALVILRSLASMDVKAAVMASSARCLSSYSKYCSRQVQVPSMVQENEFEQVLMKIVRKTRFDVLFPLFELSLLPISKNRERISRYVRLPIASHESIMTCFDKLATMKLANDNGVPIPRTYFIQSFPELKRISQEVQYPVVVKPRSSVVWGNDRVFTKRSGFVNSPRELIATYKSIHQYFPFPFVQEYIPGKNYSVAVLCNEGKPRAFCCIKVHRAWPPSGGNSCFRESAPLEFKMKEYSEVLLKALNYHGVAEIEFRLDSRDNVPKLMEINPRFWGSVGVAIKAGVNFPYLLYRMTMDGDIKSVSSYKVGIKGRFLDQDLSYLLSVFKHGSSTVGFQNPKRLRLLMNWLRFYEPGIFYDLLDFHDPIPFARYSVGSLFGLVKPLQKNYAWSPPAVRF